jgi:hypothetical protein
MRNRPLFVLVLEDNSIFAGGDFTNTKWNEIPLNKKIKRIFYSLPIQDYICLEGYDKYYHMIEATTDLSGSNSGKVRIEYAYILGKRSDKIICYKIILQSKANQKIGDVERIEYNESDSFISGLNKDGWK